MGLIGLQPAEGVSPKEHLYVQTVFQRQGIGKRLLKFGLERATSNEIYVGTWKAARWAIEFYKDSGFKIMDNPKELLKNYWQIPERQVGASVVLKYTGF